MKIAALALIAVSASVAAFVPACRVTVAWEYRVVSKAVHRHHSAAILARWRAGAAKWSLAHGGKVYRGMPARRGVQAWTPLQFGCADVATVPVELGGFLPMEDVPPVPESYALYVPMERTPIIPPPLNEAGVTVAGPLGYPPAAGGAPVFGGPVGLPSVPVPTPEPSGWLLVETGIAILMVTKLVKR